MQRAEAELVARYIGESLLTRPEAVDLFVKQNGSLARRVYEGLVDTYNRVKTYFADRQSYEARYALSDIEKGIKLFEKAFGTRRTALDEVSEKYGWSGGNVSGDVQYAKKLGGYIPENSVTSEGVLDRYNIKNINNKYEVINKVAEELKKTYLSTETQSKPIVNIDTGMEIEIRKGGINETFGNDKYFGDLSIEDRLKKLSVMPYLANMIKYGEVRATDGKNKYNPNSKVTYSYLKSQIEIDGKPYIVNMDIRKSPNGENRFYIHSLNIKEDVNQLGHNVNQLKDGQTSSYTNNTTGAGESQGKFAYKDADVPNTPFADALGNIDINSIYKNGENDAGNDWQRAKPIVHGMRKQVLVDSEGNTLHIGDRVITAGNEEGVVTRLDKYGNAEVTFEIEGDEYDSTNRADSVVKDFRFARPVATEIQQDDQMHLTDEQDYDRRLYFLKSIDEFTKRMEDEGFPDYYIDKVYNQLNYAMICGYEGDYSVFTHVLPGVDINAVKKTVLTGDLTHIFPERNKSKSIDSKADAADAGEKSVKKMSLLTTI